MKQISICFIFLLILLNACSKSSDEYRTSGAETVFIRGYVFRNNMGQDVGNIGNPDIQNTYPPGTTTIPYISIYGFPNPASKSMDIVYAEYGHPVTVRLWIVPASFTGSGSDATIFLGTPVFSTLNKPLLDTVFTTQKFAHIIWINTLPEGYYRIYMKYDGCLVWDNIVFSKEKQHYH